MGEPNQSTATGRRTLRPTVMIGPAIAASLLLVYLFSPEFYLTWVLNERDREYQAVEIITFTCALSAGVMLAISAWRLARSGGGGARRVWPILAIGVVAAASIFFAGEEISWGQTYFGWKTPESFRAVSVETNLHNTDLPIQSAGSLFLVMVFFVFPAAWRLRRRWRLPIPESLEPAVPGAASIACIATAFLWKEIKTVIRLFGGDHESSEFYWNFVEQFNEHKEMLAAVALLMYAIGRLRAARRADRLGYDCAPEHLIESPRRAG